jgi:hypothetical protein
MHTALISLVLMCGTCGDMPAGNTATLARPDVRVTATHGQDVASMRQPVLRADREQGSR